MPDNTTLSQTLSAWRTANQSGTGHQGLMSQLTIDGALYDIQDPALEAMMTALDTRLSAIEGTNPAAANVTFDNSENGFTATNVQAAIAEAVTKATDAAIGTSSDAASADTINAAKKYAEELVADLAGNDWAQNAKTVKEIIEELENSDPANAWATAIDKLAGLGVKTAAEYYTQAECDEWNAENVTGYVTAGSPVPADYETKVGSAAAGETLTTEEANAYNATLEGARKTTDVKTPAVYNTVVDYVESYVASQLGSTVSDLETLDAAAIKSVNGVSRAANDTTGAITLTGANIEVSGTDSRKLDVVIASLETNKADKSDIEANERVVAAALNDLNTNKANKAAISTATVNNWSSSYSNGNLTWTSTQPTVYVPVSGETL